MWGGRELSVEGRGRLLKELTLSLRSSFGPICS